MWYIHWCNVFQDINSETPTENSQSLIATNCFNHYRQWVTNRVLFTSRETTAKATDSHHPNRLPRMSRHITRCLWPTTAESQQSLLFPSNSTADEGISTKAGWLSNLSGWIEILRKNILLLNWHVIAFGQIKTWFRFCVQFVYRELSCTKCTCSRNCWLWLKQKWVHQTVERR